MKTSCLAHKHENCQKLATTYHFCEVFFTKTNETRKSGSQFIFYPRLTSQINLF